MAKKKQNFDVEVNLVAFISLLSVLICSLLLTAVWVNIAKIEVKQAVGGQAKTDNKKIPSVWTQVFADGTLVLKITDAGRLPRSLRSSRIPALDGKPNLPELKVFMEKLKVKVPNISTALIQPKAETLYENIIALMDEYKNLGLSDLGVAPL